MKFISGKELQGVIISISAFLVISASINAILAGWFLKWPLLLIPLSLALFLTFSRVIRRIPFLGNDQSFIGQIIHIVLVIFFYAVFTKSLLFYLDPMIASHMYSWLIAGFAVLLYAVKYHLVARDGSVV